MDDKYWTKNRQKNLLCPKTKQVQYFSNYVLNEAPIVLAKQW